MRSTYSAELTTQRDGQQALRYLETNTRESQPRKDESMAILLHELRSPLAAIQNAMAALRLRSKDESLQQRMHELIERHVRQLTLLRKV